jgi:hypothetical protein
MCLRGWEKIRLKLVENVEYIFSPRVLVATKILPYLYTPVKFGNSGFPNKERYSYTVIPLTIHHLRSQKVKNSHWKPDTDGTTNL